MYSLLSQRRLRWLGHVRRSGARPVGHPALRFKDACNRDMKACDISPKGWEAVAEDRTAWRQATHRGIERADEKKHQHAAEKRMRRKQKAALSSMSSCFICFGCSKDCHSRIGLHSHSGRCQNLKILQIDNGAHQHRLFETTLCLLLYNLPALAVPLDASGGTKQNSSS